MRILKLLVTSFRSEDSSPNLVRKFSRQLPRAAQTEWTPRGFCSNFSRRKWALGLRSRENGDSSGDPGENARDAFFCRWELLAGTNR